jgi:hypothetical protein
MHFHPQGWYMTRCDPQQSGAVWTWQNTRRWYRYGIGPEHPTVYPITTPPCHAVGTRLKAEHCSQPAVNRTALILVSLKQHASLVHWNLPRKFPDSYRYADKSLYRPEKRQVNVDKKNQLDDTFCILYFSSNSCSTCFGEPCAHHQELTNSVWIRKTN